MGREELELPVVDADELGDDLDDGTIGREDGLVDDVDETTAMEEEDVGIDEEVDEVELEAGIITADELDLELELVEVLEELSVDVELELETTDRDGTGIATEELGLLVETAALEVDKFDAAVIVETAISHISEA